MGHGLLWTGLRPTAGFALAGAIATALAGGVPPAAPARAQDAEALACKDCHEEADAAAPKSIHAKVVADPHLDSCEMCHVGREGHVKFAQGDAGKERPANSGFAKPVDCLLCHKTIPDRHAKSMPAWKGMQKDAACTACHIAHGDAAEWKAARSAGPFDSPKSLAAAGAKPSPAGQATCAKCHDAPVRSFEASAHREAGATCEACHGNGSVHASSGGVVRWTIPFPAKDAALQARFCLNCHEKDAPDHAKDFRKHKYSEGGKTCASCHRVHEEGAPAEAAKGAKPVGTDACLKCHPDAHPDLGRSVHAPLVAPKAVGCEGCHGNGSAHAAAAGKKEFILSPRRLPAAERDGMCLQCHRGTSSPAAWAATPHGGTGMGCVDCHDTVAPRAKAEKALGPDACAKCHSIQAAQFRLPNHHPVWEGALGCADCHDLHRPSPPVFAARKWTDTCAACHRTESAPRLHPHEATRGDGCIACHEPHGTPNPRLLRFGRTVDLCLSCHIPPASHDLSPGSAYSSCLACHTEIHGSDADRKLLR